MNELFTTARPLRADARRNRERILEAAGATFADRGLDAQMDEVAERAGVGVGTVYRHFPTKTALLAELIRQKFARFTDRASRALDDPGEPFEVFAAVLRDNAEMMAADAATQQALGQAGPEVWSSCEDAHLALLEATQPLLDRAKAAGTLRPDFEVHEIGLLMCGVGATMGTSGPAPGDWRRHLEIMLDGLRAR